MKKILLTGGTGFVGKNILPILKEEYDVIAPKRQQLDLKNTEEVLRFVTSQRVDVIVHSANPNPVKSFLYDSNEHMLEDSIRIYMNLYKAASECEKMIYFGSGAEYDKKMDICSIAEEEVTRSLPTDTYGYSKYIMNELARNSRNVYNLRLFACYGPDDHESKFITHAIRCCLKNQPITIRQNCYFDYLHVYDVARIVLAVIRGKMKYHDYNVASGTRIQLKEIAEIVREKMENNKPVLIEKSGFNKEYTASIERLERELNMKKSFISLDAGIEMQIACEKELLK